MTTTIEDVWKHISNKIANKVNNPFEELFAMVIPIDTEGNFCKEINSDCDEYEGDSYTLLRKLSENTSLLPTGTFAYACPARVRQIDAAEAEGKTDDELRAMAKPREILMVSLVHEITADEEGNPTDVIIENGVYWIDDNTFSELPKSINGYTEDGEETSGQLTVALGALGLKWSLTNDRLGELGRMLNESLELAKKALEQAETAFNKLPRP